MYKYILYFTMLIIGASCGSSTDEEEILDRLAIQTECWNSGDIDCFMIGYWESDSLMFIGSDGVTYGYENALERYYRRYPDEVSMGKLQFDIKHINRISDDAFYVVGKFHLTREIDDLEGHFTLLWRKINEQWVIVADHTP